MKKKTAKKSKSKSKKQTAKKPYIPIMKRAYKNDTEFSSIISKHASHNPNASAVRGKENARLRKTMKDGKGKTINISLEQFKNLFSGKPEQLSKKSVYDRIRTKIVNALLKKGYNKKCLVSFPYKNRDTKEGDLITLASRIRTACKAKFINREKLNQIEIHKVSRTVSKKEIMLIKYAEEEIK